MPSRLLLLLCLVACGHEVVEGSPCLIHEVTRRPNLLPQNDLDVLFVIDTTEGMADAQAAIARELPGFIERLTSGVLPDGRPTRRLNLRFAVVTSDMGVGTANTDACDPRGGDGILRSDSASEDCPFTLPQFVDVNPWLEPATLDQRENQLACLAQAGSEGCRFQQPLDAALKALTPSGGTFPSGEPVTFTSGSTGHADGANRGYRRFGRLAVFILTTADDCSALDPDVYSADSARYPTEPLGLRCARHPEALYPLRRYVQGLLAVTSVETLSVSMLVGIPTDLVREVNLDAVLDDPRMQQLAMGGELAPSCTSGQVSAEPPRRLLALAQELREQGVPIDIGSICSPSYQDFFDAAATRIQRRFSGRCLSLPIPRGADGLIPCQFVEVLPATGEITACDQLPDRVALEPTPEGNARCIVRQLTPAQADAGERGWFYDDESELLMDACSHGQQLAFTDAQPRASTWTFTCQELSSVSPVSCTSAPDCAEGLELENPARFPLGFSCDRERGLCTPACRDESDCPTDFLCEERESGRFCVDPTCR